MNSAKDQPTIV